jgi:hypothetical protein
MPELTQAIGYKLQPQVFQPIAPSSYFNRQLPVQPDIPVDKAAKAGIFSSLVKALGELPGQLNKEWTAGKKRGTSELVRQKFDTALKSGDDTQLSNFSVDASGNVLFKPEKKEDSDLLAAKKAYYDALKAKAEAGGAGGKKNLHEKISGMFDGGTSGGSVEPPLPTHDEDGGLNADPFSPETLPKPTGESELHPGEQITDESGDLSSFSAPTTAPDLTNPVDAGVQNAVSQLGNVDAGSLLASNNAAGQPATVNPMATDPATGQPIVIDQATGQPVVKKALPVTGRSVNHRTGEVYLRNADGSVMSKDPITQEIKMKSADGRQFELLPGSNAWKEIPNLGTKPSALLLREAAQMGIDTDGMTNGQVAAAMEKTEKDNGIIRPSRLPVAQSLARLVVGHPALKHYPTIKEAKETVDAGLANPDTGGFGDMALVEGFQRMVNPGATVRSQTMQQMLKAAGLAQYADLGFLMDHFKEGQKFNDATRARLKKLATDIFERATKNAMPQLNGLKKLARSYGITNPDDFVNNVLSMAPVLSTTGEDTDTTGAAATAAPAPAAGGVPVVTTQEQYDALPSGASYKDSNGRLAKKK